jgi:hypothetical protein
MKSVDHIRIALALSAAMFLAVLPLPYGFYTLLRIAVFGGGAYFAAILWERERAVAYCLAFAALLFNPIWPVHLSREIWLPINFAGMALFAVVAWKFFTAGDTEASAREADGE